MKRKTGQGDAENFQWEKDIGLFTVFTVVFQHVGKFVENFIFSIYCIDRAKIYSPGCFEATKFDLIFHMDSIFNF